MPRSKVTLTQSVQYARNRINQIITKYKNQDLLLIQANDFKGTKNPALKQPYNDYKTLYKNKLIVQSYDEGFDDCSLSSSNQFLREQQHCPQDPPPFVVANATAFLSTSLSSQHPSSFTANNNQCTSITETTSTATTA